MAVTFVFRRCETQYSLVISIIEFAKIRNVPIQVVAPTKALATV